MDWRNILNQHSGSNPLYPHNPQYSGNVDNIADITEVTDKVENVMEAYFESAIHGVIEELNATGIRMQSIPVELRRQSHNHETEMTDAANRGDREAFVKALAAWRRCFTSHQGDHHGRKR